MAAVPEMPDPSPLGPVPSGLRDLTTSDRRVLARSSTLVAGRIVSKLAVVIFLVVAARLLTKAQYGLYSYILILAQTFAILADPQVSIVAGRDVSAGRRSATVAYWTALPVVVAAGLLAAVALLVFGTIDSGPGSTFTLLLITGVYVVCNRMLGLGLDLLRALGRFTAEVTVETAGTVLLVIVASVVAAVGGGVSAVLVVFAAHAALSALACHLLLRGTVGAPAVDPGYRRDLVRSGLSLAGAAGATALATRGPLIVLGLVASAAAFAGLSAALRFADAFYVLALTAGQAMLPSLAAILTEEPGRAIRLARRGVLLMLAVGAAVAAVLAPFGDEFTRAIFGSAYASSGALLTVLALSLPFMGMFWISWFGLTAYDRERVVLAVTVSAAALALVAAIVVVPAEGALGAAWVYSATIAALALGTYAALERCARRHDALRRAR